MQTCQLFSSRLILTNLSLYYVCRKRSASSSVMVLRQNGKVGAGATQLRQLHEMTEVIKTNQPNQEVTGLGHSCAREQGGVCNVGRMSKGDMDR